MEEEAAEEIATNVALKKASSSEQMIQLYLSDVPLYLHSSELFRNLYDDRNICDDNSPQFYSAVLSPERTKLKEESFHQTSNSPQANSVCDDVTSKASFMEMRIVRTPWFDYLATDEESDEEDIQLIDNYSVKVVKPLNDTNTEPVSDSSENHLDAENSSSDHETCEENALELEQKLSVQEQARDNEMTSNSEVKIEEQLLEFPKAVLKMDLRLKTVRDLAHLLRTMRFWGLDDLPRRLCVFCLDSPVTEGLLKVIDEYITFLPQLKLLRHIITAESDAQRMLIAVENNHLKLMKWMHADTQIAHNVKRTKKVEKTPVKYNTRDNKNTRTQKDKKKIESYKKLFRGNDARFWSVDVTALAARKGLLPCLEYAHRHHCPWNADTTASAAEEGHLECLMYAHQHGCPWDSRVFLGAAAGWHRDCIIYALDNNCPFPKEDVDYIAIDNEYGKDEGLLRDIIAYHGDIELLQRLLQVCPPPPNTDWRPQMQVYAAMSRNVECLKFVRQYEEEYFGSFIWDQDTTVAAAQYGSLECLQYAVRNGCLLHSDCCAKAFAAGHLDCLQYLRSIHSDWNAPWNHQYRCTYQFARREHHICLEYALHNGCEFASDFCNHAAESGHLECLQIAVRQGFEWGVSTCSSAAVKNSLECLKYAHELGCPWDEKTTSTAAVAGSVACLKYALDENCPVANDLCARLARIGQFECLQILHNHGSLLTGSVFEEAARGGHYNIIEYTIRHGSLLDETLLSNKIISIFDHLLNKKQWPCIHAIIECGMHTQNYLTECAASHGDVDMLRLLREKNCTWNEYASLAAVTNGHLICLKYLHNHGCPWHSKCCIAALEKGHVHIFEYCMEHGAKIPSWEHSVGEGTVAEFLVNGFYTQTIQMMTKYIEIGDNSLLMQSAAATGRLDVLQFLESLGVLWDAKCCEIAASHGYHHCLTYLHGHGCEWAVNTCIAAAEGAHLSCLRYACEEGCPCDENVLLAAVQVATSPVMVLSSMNCLKYLHEQGCPWHPKLLHAAIAKKRLDMIKFALQNDFLKSIHHGKFSEVEGKEWDMVPVTHLPEEVLTWCSRSSDNCISFQQWLIAINNKEILDLACKAGISLTAEMAKLAVDMDLLDIIQYLYQNGCGSGNDCYAAALANDLDALKRIRTRGGVWNTNIYICAIKHGNMLMFDYAHRNGCPWNESVTSCAAEYGRINFLKYAHRNGCPWDYSCTEVAEENEQWECLNYAKSNGCPYFDQFESLFSYNEDY